MYKNHFGNPCKKLSFTTEIQILFFLSGMAALIYQVAWQRMIMAFLGVDSTSITLMVASFLGFLGLGSLAGEKASECLSAREGILVFCLAEAVIGTAGIFSPDWINWLGNTCRTSTLLEKSYITALAVGLPVFLMGFTLPVLIETMRPHFQSLYSNVGRIYAINAFGSAVAAIATVSILFPVMGLSAVVYVAAALNFMIAFLVFLVSRMPLMPPVVGEDSRTSDMAVAQAASVHAQNPRLSWKVICILAFCTGALTISQEVTLLRMIAWAASGQPWSFGLGVGTFLIGLAAGSLKIAETPEKSLPPIAGQKWILNGICLSVFPGFSIYASVVAQTSMMGAAVLSVCLGLIGYLGGCSLTILTGLLKSSTQKGSKFGYIYAANVAGSVVGSIATGYFLFEIFQIHDIVIASSIASLFFGCLLLLVAYRPGIKLLLMVFAFCSVFSLVLYPVLGGFYSRWKSIFYSLSLADSDFIFTRETRSGIVGVYPAKRGYDDIVIGGNVYDGRFNVDPIIDSNAIHRVYISMVLFDKPRRIMDIGLASGSGLKAAMSFPSVRQAVSVELNNAYYDVVKFSPVVSDILSDTRIDFVNADGRKYLADHDARWDIIMINASYHWREGATLLHSREFLRLARSRLSDNGILMLNTTSADAIAATALDVYPEVWKIYNFILAINGTLDNPGDDLLVARLMQSSEFRKLGMGEAETGKWLSAHRPVRLDKKDFAGCPILTDDSMAAEWGRHNCN